MGMSDMIASFIVEVLEDKDGRAELQRAELAQRFNCVPSQINYVISTRFSPEHGYIVESRRGGGGYIRITRVRAPEKALLMHMVNAIGDELGHACASAFLSNALGSGAITARDCTLISAAICENALKPLPPEERDKLRASILKHILLHSI
jgi:transcriptional regulator CtsR